MKVLSRLSPQAKAGLALGAAGIVITGAALVIDRDDPPPAAPAATTTTTAPTSTTTTLPSTTVAVGPAVVLLPEDEHDHAGVDLVPAHDTAVRFVDAWLLPTDPETRRVLLAPVTAPRFLDMVASLPPEALPVATVDSVGGIEWDGYRAFVTVHLTHGLTVRVTVVETGTGWLVSDIEEAS